MVALHFGRFVVLPALVVLGISCIQTNRPKTITESPHPGMMKIAASGKSFPLGTNDSLANHDEKPAMPVSFSYDYWIDTTEVTQGNYQEVMGSNPVPDTSAYGKGAKYPVYYVSWFDAALFCNAKSKKLGLDTVYSYYNVNRRIQGSVYDLIGLRIHYDRNGIRLPTEAEWEYAALEASSKEPFASPSDSISALSDAWYINDANGITHPAAVKMPNALGLYDMAGNVFEWTEDWKGPHVAKPVVNPGGSQESDPDFERVIKGGSFKNSIFSLRATCRSATYPTAASSACEYVGFRCALGAIPNPSFVTSDTASLLTNPVDMVVNDMRPILGTSQAKIVFVNVTNWIRTLCMIDYSEPRPHIREFTDVRSVYLPVISPDGRFVAFCNRDVGFGDSSSVFIRSLDSIRSPVTRLPANAAYAPRWWVNHATGDTLLVYTNSAIDNNLAEWSATKTYLQKITGGYPSGVPAELIGNGSFHDGLSRDGNYAATGYTRLLMRNLQTGEEKQLFVAPLNGKPPAGPTQVCNVSICPDSAHPDRCMFLDFGSTSSTLVGAPYGVHQYIFIADFSGAVVSWLKYPDGENSWDYPKWSTDKRYAVATARDASDNGHSVFVVSLTQNMYARLLEGFEIDHPFLWVGPMVYNGDALSSDSLGHYDDPPIDAFEEEAAYKMQLFWKMHDSVEIAVVGNSMAAHGIDCREIKGYVSINMAWPAAGLEGFDIWIRDYIIPHCPNIKLILLGPDPSFFYLKNGDNTWETGIGTSIGYLYDKNHQFWRPTLPPFFSSVMALAPKIGGYVDSLLGQYPGPCNGWGGPNPVLEGTIAWDTSLTEYKENISTLRSLARDLAALQIHLVVVNFPQSPAYKTTDHYNRYGPSWNTAHYVISQLASLEPDSNSFYHFYDADLDGNHDYGDQDAMDCNHLCPTGAIKLTTRLDSLIHAVLR
jgi:uncharacterized protein (TIGR02171 family)